MNPYHKACGSEDLGKKIITVKKAKRFFETEMDVCYACKRLVESYEIARPDRRVHMAHITKKAAKKGITS